VSRGYGTYHIEFAREEGCPTILGLALIGRMTLEKLALSFERLLDRLRNVNVTLATVYNRYIAQTQRNDATGKDVNDISASIPVFIDVNAAHADCTRNLHEIDFRKDTNSPRSLGIDLAGHLETV